MSLGRGLGALISAKISEKKPITDAPGASGESIPSDQRIWQIPLTQIIPNAEQPRRNFDPEELNELAESIKSHGVLQPILLTEKADGRYELVAGERRWRAAKIAGLTSIPSIVKKFPQEKRLMIALIENIQRENLNPIEEGFAYRRLAAEYGLTHQQIADQVGKKRPTVSNMIRLLDLPEPAQAALIERKIGISQAKSMLVLPSREQQMALLNRLLGEKIVSNELERVVRRSNPESSRQDPNLNFMEEKLRQVLGTRVVIAQRGGKGNIKIDYYSKEELARLIKKISGED